MKYIRTYEDLNNDETPEIGDYVYCDVENIEDYDPPQFIGKLVDICPEKLYPYRVNTLFNDTDVEEDDDEGGIKLVKRYEIIDFSSIIFTRFELLIIFPILQTFIFNISKTLDFSFLKIIILFFALVIATYKIFISSSKLNFFSLSIAFL